MSNFLDVAEAFRWLGRAAKLCECSKSGAVVAYSGYNRYCRDCAERFKPAVPDRVLRKVGEYDDVEKLACQILTTQFGGTRWNSPEHWSLPEQPPELHPKHVGEELGGNEPGDGADHQGDGVPDTERAV